MDIFISWSGLRSEAVAKALHGWLPMVVNDFKPWLSSADIDKGARWNTDVAAILQAAKAGIICLTPDSLHSEWVIFEAGALSKTLESTFVCPLLVGLEPSEIKGPLAQFQATRATKTEVLRLLKTLNKPLAEKALPDAHIERAFEVWWPKLGDEFQKLPSEETAAVPLRTERDLLEEILGLVRNQNRTAQEETSSAPRLSAKYEIANAVVQAVQAIDPGATEFEFIETWQNLDFIFKSGNGLRRPLRVPARIEVGLVAAVVARQLTPESSGLYAAEE